jgi:energy-coupling factor transporter transmembrane protein EcfT
MQNQVINWTKALQQISSIKIKSITDGPFIYALILFLFGIITAISKVPAWITIVVFSVAGLVLLIAIIFYCYFCFKNPDYLRSESYQLRKHSIEILGDKENLLNVNIKEIKYITSPLAFNESKELQIGENEK